MTSHPVECDHTCGHVTVVTCQRVRGRRWQVKRSPFPRPSLAEGTPSLLRVQLGSLRSAGGEVLRGGFVKDGRVQVFNFPRGTRNLQGGPLPP